MPTKITAVKLGHMHKGCQDRYCPVCLQGKLWNQMTDSDKRVWTGAVAHWMRMRGLDVTAHGDTSPWWQVRNAAKYCYAKLK